MPPPLVALLPEKIALLIVKLAAAVYKPPPSAALLSEKVQLTMVSSPLKSPMPPPSRAEGLLPVKVQLVTVRFARLFMAPPSPLPALLSEKVTLVTVKCPSLVIALELPWAIVRLLSVSGPPVFCHPSG